MAQDNSLGLSAIGQISVTVQDLDRAVEFYRDQLGMQFLFRVPRMAFFNCSGVRLLLGLSEDESADVHASILYYKVEDLEGTCEALRSRGVTFDSGPHKIADMPDHELWMAFFRDSETNLMALMAEKPIEKQWTRHDRWSRRMDELEELSFSFRCIVDRPVDEVFEAVADRTAISTYFTDDASAGLEAGRTVIWRFGDIEVDVFVDEVIRNRKIACNWPASNDVGYRTRFSFDFEALNGGTRISVSESGWRPDLEGIDSAFDQCSGWTHFFASLKARLEYDVDLKRFYDDHGG